MHGQTQTLGKKICKTISMNDSIDIEDSVDRYILDQMGEAEREAFEQDLLVNDALKEEYLAQKVIADSVQRVALRHFLVKKSNQLSGRRVSTLSEVIDSVIGHFKEYMYHPRRILVTASIAASVMVAVVGAIDYTNKSGDMVELSAQYYSQTLPPVLRGDNEEGGYLANILESQKQDVEWYSAVVEMKKGHLIRAKKQLTTISKSNSQYADEAKLILQTIF